MIISDEHRFAFVHIPKCAGVSVKRALRAIDSTDGYFLRIAEHPEMGMAHYAHITLRDLEAHFPEEYAKIRSYRSVALVRDPIDRFFSGIYQRLREFKQHNQSEITASVIETEAAAVIRYLAAAPARLDFEHVHFNRQVDYVFHSGERVVEKVFALDRMADVAAYVAECTGVALEEERKNRTTEIRFAGLKPFVRLLRRPYGALVPYAARAWVRASLVRTGVYGDVEKQGLLRPGSRIDGFVREYYAQDVALYSACRGMSDAAIPK